MQISNCISLLFTSTLSTGSLIRFIVTNGKCLNWLTGDKALKHTAKQINIVSEHLGLGDLSNKLFTLNPIQMQSIIGPGIILLVTYCNRYWASSLQFICWCIMFSDACFLLDARMAPRKAPSSSCQGCSFKTVYLTEVSKENWKLELSHTHT